MELPQTHQEAADFSLLKLQIRITLLWMPLGVIPLSTKKPLPLQSLVSLFPYFPVSPSLSSILLLPKEPSPAFSRLWSDNTTSEVFFLLSGSHPGTSQGSLRGAGTSHKNQSSSNLR